MIDFEIPFIRADEINDNNNCTDVCKHVMSCAFCKKFSKTNDNNMYFMIIIGFLIILIIILMFKK